jgi:hypothetical protein
MSAVMEALSTTEAPLRSTPSMLCIVRTTPLMLMDSSLSICRSVRSGNGVA